MHGTWNVLIPTLNNENAEVTRIKVNDVKTENDQNL